MKEQHARICGCHDACVGLALRSPPLIYGYATQELEGCSLRRQFAKLGHVKHWMPGHPSKETIEAFKEDNASHF
jgi:hypothetical protein